MCQPPGTAPEGHVPVRKNGKFGFVSQSCAKAKGMPELCASSRLHGPILETATLLDMCQQPNALNQLYVRNFEKIATFDEEEDKTM